MSDIFGAQMAMPPQPMPGPAGMDGPAMMPQVMPPVPMLHNVKLVRKTNRGRARVMAVPPEEFAVSRMTKLGALQETDYCHHRTIRTAADLIDDGFDEDSVDEIPAADFDDTEESSARDTVDDHQSGTGASNLNEALRRVEVTEHYIRMKYDEDKVCLYRVTTAGDSATLLYRDKKPAIEKVEEIPFASITPYITTHRFFGRSAADMVMDIQRIKTAILRQLLDSMYLSNNQRTEISEEHASEHTIDDWLTNRPGGIVRTKRPGGLLPIPNSDIGGFGYPLLEYWDNAREWRTGVTRQGQGIGSDSLKNVGEEVLISMFNMAQAKVRLIARVFAETGVRDMFLLLHAITRRNASKAETVRLRREWVEIDPSKWRRRDDMTVTVGIGSGSKAQQLTFLMNLLGLQKEALAAGGLGMVRPKHVYNTLKRLVEASGFRSVDPFADDPEDPENQQQGGAEQQPDPKMLEVQAKAKAKEAEIAIDAEMSKKKLEAEMAQKVAQLKAEGELKIEQMRAEFELKRQQMSMEAQLRREQMATEAALKQQQTATKAQTDMGKAALDALDGGSDGISDVRMGGEVG